VSLYENIHKKRKRIAAGSGETMRDKGDKGAPTEANFTRAAKTAKKAMYGGTMKKNMKDGGRLKDHSGDGKVTRKDYLIQVGAEGFEKNQDMGTGGNVCKTRKKMSYGGKMKNYASEGKKYGGSANMPNPRKPMGTM
jgi:hypothetical protein